MVLGSWRFLQGKPTLYARVGMKKGIVVKISSQEGFVILGMENSHTDAPIRKEVGKWTGDCKEKHK